MSTFEIKIKKVHNNPIVSIEVDYNVIPKTFVNTGWSSGLIQRDEISIITAELRNVADTLEEFYEG